MTFQEHIDATGDVVNFVYNNFPDARWVQV